MRDRVMLPTHAQIEAGRAWATKKAEEIVYTPPEGQQQRIRQLLEQAIQLGFEYGVEVATGEVG